MAAYSAGKRLEGCAREAVGASRADLVFCCITNETLLAGEGDIRGCCSLV